ncbi:MAG: Rieske 2Fe-2S domain-containing protein, partial [Actinomycetota bacterium]
MSPFADHIGNVQTYIQLPLLYEHWYVAGTGEEFDRTPKERTILERSLVFYRTVEGRLVAAQNRCLHRSFPLAESRLEGDELVCGYHGIRYDPEGTIVRIPSQKKCPDRKLRTYPVVEQGPFAFIWMGEGDPDHAALPDLAFLADPD